MTDDLTDEELEYDDDEDDEGENHCRPGCVDDVCRALGGCAWWSYPVAMWPFSPPEEET